MKTLHTDEAMGYVYDGHVAVQEVSRHRWYTKRLVIFRDGDDLLGFYYLDPATEMQEDGDLFESVPVTVFPVVGRELVTMTYEPA